MKTKFKDLLLYSLATIGVVALFISTTTKSTNDVGKYQITGYESSPHHGIYRLNTTTGEIVKIKLSNLEKINLHKK